MRKSFRVLPPLRVVRRRRKRRHLREDLHESVAYSLVLFLCLVEAMKKDTQRTQSQQGRRYSCSRIGAPRQILRASFQKLQNRNCWCAIFHSHLVCSGNHSHALPVVSSVLLLLGSFFRFFCLLGVSLIFLFRSNFCLLLLFLSVSSDLWTEVSFFFWKYDCRVDLRSNASGMCMSGFDAVFQEDSEHKNGSPFRLLMQ